jgi:hypothetical protein
MDRYPKLEFRDGTFERRAALRDGPEVWEIVFFSVTTGTTS